MFALAYLCPYFFFLGLMYWNELTLPYSSFLVPHHTTLYDRGTVPLVSHGGTIYLEFSDYQHFTAVTPLQASSTYTILCTDFLPSQFLRGHPTYFVFYLFLYNWFFGHFCIFTTTPGFSCIRYHCPSIPTSETMVHAYNPITLEVAWATWDQKIRTASYPLILAVS